MIKFALLVCFVLSCAQLRTGVLKSYLKEYNYTDLSGEYRLNKLLRIIKKEIITRVELKNPSSNKVLEKTTAVSVTKKLDGKNLILPKVAEHKVWFEGKLYYSKIEADVVKKEYRVVMKSPEKKWSGTKTFSAPKGKNICWFSQLPDCLRFLNLLDTSGKSEAFWVAWDSYPYYSEQLNGIENPELFSEATIRYDSDFEGFKRFELNLKNNLLYYFFDDKMQFRKYFWIAQGISMSQRE